MLVAFKFDDGLAKYLVTQPEADLIGARWELSPPGKLLGDGVGVWRIQALHVSDSETLLSS